MEFLLQPLESAAFLAECDNKTCPINEKQCGCNTVQGCACPKQIMEP